MGVKPKIPEEKKEVIYLVLCKDCDKVYIGETKRTLKIRVSKNKQAVKKTTSTGKRTLEAIQIHSELNTMNLDW